MGLEMMGFTKANLEALWIDPEDYQLSFRGGARAEAMARVPVMIYNHPLCS